MRLKHLLLPLLAVLLCLGLTACGTTTEAPEKVRKDLAAMTDEQLIPVLLENYSDGQEPTIFSAEMSWLYRSGETVIAEMEGTTRRNGNDRMLSVTYTVGETSKQEEYVYRDGICYVNAGTKRKASKSAEEVAAYFATLSPVFGKASDYNFARKDLLRSDNGTYTLVLSSPAGGIPDSADIIKPLTAAGNKTAPVTMSGFSDLYLTLFFSAEGTLLGQTLGFDCNMDDDGAVTEGTVLLQYAITSTSVAQLPIPLPAESDTYADAATDLFAEDDAGVTDGSDEDSEDGDTSASDEE